MGKRITSDLRDPGTIPTGESCLLGFVMHQDVGPMDRRRPSGLGTGDGRRVLREIHTVEIRNFLAARHWWTPSCRKQRRP